METRMPSTERTALSLRSVRLTAEHDTAVDADEQLVSSPGAGKDDNDQAALAAWRRRLDELYAVKDDLAGQRSSVLRQLREHRRARPTPTDGLPLQQLPPGSAGWHSLWGSVAKR